MADEPDGVDMQLMAAFGRRPTSTARGRRMAETRPMHFTDGRALRSTGRTAQMNLKVRPDFKDRVAALARNHGLLMVEYIERAVEEKAARDGTG